MTEQDIILKNNENYDKMQEKTCKRYRFFLLIQTVL